MASKTATVPSKMCVRCGKVKPLADFYVNKDWKEQNGRDVWCKECVADYCITKELIQEYCWYNNRKYSDELWERAERKSQYVLAINADYLSGKTSKKKKDEIATRAACRQFFSIMNAQGMYHYSDNIRPDEPIRPFPGVDATNSLTRATASQLAADEEENLVYSNVWNGYYTEREIAYLDKYYEDLENDFVLDNRNLQDYARKVAKASLDVDSIQDKRRRGQATMDELNRAQQMFDKYSQSAAFAACKRQAGQNAGFGSMGQIIEQIEITGAIQKVNVTFPEDDIDRINHDFLHTLAAVGIGSGE